MCICAIHFLLSLLQGIRPFFCMPDYRGCCGSAGAGRQSERENLLFPFLQQFSHSGNLLKQPGYQCPRDAREQNPYQRPGKYPQRFTEERPCRLCFREDYMLKQVYAQTAGAEKRWFYQTRICFRLFASFKAARVERNSNTIWNQDEREKG